MKHYYKTKRKTFKDVKKFKEILPILEQFGEVDIDKESIFNFKETINNKPLVKIEDIRKLENKLKETNIKED